MLMTSLSSGNALMPGSPRCAIVSAASPAAGAALRPPELPTLLPVLRPLLPLPPLLLCALWSPFAKPEMTGCASRGSLPNKCSSVKHDITVHEIYLHGASPHKHALLWARLIALPMLLSRTQQSPKISTCNHLRQGNMPCKDAGWLLEPCGDMDAALSWNPEKPLLLESWRHAVLPNLHAQAANQLHHETH